MTHLSDEQLEDVLAGLQTAEQLEHLNECVECRQKLGDIRAVQARLKSAFEGAAVPAGLHERIAQALDGPAQAAQTDFRQTSPAVPATAARPVLAFFRRRVVQAISAAAAVIAVAVILAVYFSGPTSAEASQKELVNIHRMNLSEGHDFVAEDEPAKLAQYFRERLGFTPLLPRLNQGMAIRGCCVAHFRGEIAGSYVVNTPHGLASIIVVTDEPASIGLTATRTLADGQTAWTGALGMCNMAAVRMGKYTYTAVGETSVDSLTQLLGLLVSQDG
ncbi:MAG: hypothetical protein ACE15C_08820 [Phycisphaerae bacterium]